MKINTLRGAVDPHEVDDDRVEIGAIYCGDCGEEVIHDGDTFHHIAIELDACGDREYQIAADGSRSGSWRECVGSVTHGPDHEWGPWQP
jgi:hypothetical protein